MQTPVTNEILRNRRLGWKGLKWRRPVFEPAAIAKYTLRSAEMESDFKSVGQSRYYYTPFPSIASSKRDINRSYVRDTDTMLLAAHVIKPIFST